MTDRGKRAGTTWIHAWERYWFTDIPPHSYALLRVALGIVGLLGLAGLTPLSMYWPADSLAPSVGGGLGLRAYAVALGLGTDVGYALYATLLLSFFCITAGVFTTLTMPLAFIATALQGLWNPLPLSASHKAFVALLFCLMWADCGGALTFRSWSSAARHTGHPTRAIWPLRLMRAQIAIVYLGSGIAKFFGPSWRDGSAVHYALTQNAFHRFPAPLPPSMEWLLTLATYFTLTWELAFIVLVFNRRTRASALWLGVALHLGMGVAMELGTFSLVMITSYVAFVEPRTVERVVTRISGRFRSRSIGGPEDPRLSAIADVN